MSFDSQLSVQMQYPAVVLQIVPEPVETAQVKLRRIIATWICRLAVPVAEEVAASQVPTGRMAIHWS